MVSIESVFCADFETTTEENLIKDGQVRVWLWSLVKCSTMEEWYGYDIPSFLKILQKQKVKLCFFHNLRFDGKFLVDYFLRNNYIYGKDFETIIDGMNVWYEVKIRQYKNVTKCWDSLKKFPGQSVASLAKLYNYPDKKDKPDFTRYIPKFYKPTNEEIEYCLQDSRIVAYAIKKEWEDNRTRMTLSSDAFNLVKEMCLGGKYWRDVFPIIKGVTQEVLRDSYRGGFTYGKPEILGKEISPIYVYDVNSLYPYVMENCELPYSYPVFKKEPDKGDLYIINFKAAYKLKEGYLPTLQIRNSYKYNPSEYITESNGVDNLSMTNIDFKLFKEHYDIDVFYDDAYICFQKKVGLLKPYIDYWKQVKIDATTVKDEQGKIIHQGNDALRYIAKRFLNSPYGKTGMRESRVNKLPTIDDGQVAYNAINETVEPIYLPYATFVTSQARNITIRAAQANYDNFIYSDTDSIHLTTNKPKGIKVHPTEFGCFKLESECDIGKYMKAKTYIHANIVNGKKEITEVHCAGLISDVISKMKYEDFRYGYTSNQNRKVYTVPGGAIIKNCEWKMSAPFEVIKEDEELIKSFKMKYFLGGVDETN